VTALTVLVVEDDADLRGILRDNLTCEGYRVLEAGDGIAGLDLALEVQPNLIIMDIMMPRLDGLEAVRRLRARNAWMPVVFLSARGDEVDRILGLEIGGDDYVTKPFSMRELLSRVKVILRRTGTARPAGGVTIGDRVVHLERYTIVQADGSTTTLTDLEARLLELLVREEGTALTRARILDEVWGLDAYPTDRTVDNAIVRLRRKLEPDPRQPSHILTVHGVGYRLIC
jgi:DNA-binding response OmpR family regulator